MLDRLEVFRIGSNSCARSAETGEFCAVCSMDCRRDAVSTSPYGCARGVNALSPCCEILRLTQLRSMSALALSHPLRLASRRPRKLRFRRPSAMRLQLRSRVRELARLRRDATGDSPARLATVAVRFATILHRRESLRPHCVTYAGSLRLPRYGTGRDTDCRFRSAAGRRDVTARLAQLRGLGNVTMPASDR